MRSALAILVIAAGCSMGGDNSPTPDAPVNQNDGGPSDSGMQGCVIGIDPMDPIASPTLPIRAFVTVMNPIGPVTFDWNVTFNGNAVAFTQESSDGSQIGFYAPAAGSYRVTVTIDNVPGCSYTEQFVNVTAPGANTVIYRLRTVAQSSAPPQETLVQVKGGSSQTRTITLDRGITASAFVMNSATSAGIPAYVKFMPNLAPTAFVETFASSSGAYSVRLLPRPHQVLVIPAVPGLAPKLLTWSEQLPNQQFNVGPGTVVTGTVRGPGGAGFSGAKVQLYAGGVPSTIGTTAADGSYSVRTDFPPSATQVTVKVTPPANGLPRLEATSAFNLGAAINVTYAASLATCDLANVPVRRGGTLQPNAQVSVVGSLAITAGTIAGVNATNTVRMSATADGAGRLPAMLVPRGALSAVTELSMTDHAVSAVDTSACSVAQIDAPAMTMINGTTKKPDMTAIGNIRIEAEPTGVLALAGVAAVQVTSNGSGGFALPLGGSGRYNVRFFDPAQRVAPITSTNVLPGQVPTNAILEAALTISGDVKLDTNEGVIGASIQILCSTCMGIEATRPITETVSNTAAKYAIAVPDPGTM